MIKSIYQQLFSEKFRLQLHISFRKLKALTLSGKDVYCPCCEKSFSKFLSKGNGLETRDNAVCPNCGSLERTRLLCMYLKNETQIFKDFPHILHIAPEEVLKGKLVSNPNYIDADLNPNFASTQMDITEIKFPDNYFDYIICSHVLGHVPAEQKAVTELYRVLKPSGKLFFLSLLDPGSPSTIEEPNITTSPEEKLKMYGEKDLQRLYGLDFAERVRRQEVTIETIDYRENFSPAERTKMSLGDGKREIIFKVSKI